MSLISTKNFLAPLNNKVHLVTIILATFAFATLRLSGCSVNSVSSGTHLKKKIYSTKKDKGLRVQKDKKIYKFKPTKNVKNAPSKNTTGESGALDDIEKIMGMR